nr:uncharacterized protein LOC106680596 [Halyomorpha halys]
MKVCSQEMHGCMFGVVVIQVITWILVSALLFYRGINNLWKAQPQVNITTWNTTLIQSEDPTMKGYTAGVIILIIASIMIVIGPTFIIVVVVEKCYRKRKFKKLPQEDLPPKYEDVVLQEMAPRYSSLFLNNERVE